MENYKKKAVKKISFTGVIMTITALIIAISSCSKEELMEPSIETVIENFEDETLLDDVIAYANEYYTSLDNITLLEEKLSIIKEIEDLKIDENNEISDDLKEKYSTLTTDEVKALMEILNSQDATPVELKSIAAGLTYIKGEYKNWIRKTGTAIAEELLKKAIKQGACSASGLEAKYYTEWKIGVVDKTNYSNDIECIDPKSKKTIRYELKDIYLDASNTLCNIQGLDKSDDYKTVEMFCIEALNYTKIICASGAEIEESWFGDSLIPKTKEKYAKEKVLSLTK